MLNENYTQAFLERMYKVMEEKNITEEELFSQANFSKREQTMIKNGNFGRMEFFKVSRIAYILNVPMDYLTGHIDEINEKPLEMLYRQLYFCIMQSHKDKDCPIDYGQVMKKIFNDIDNSNFSKEEMDEFLSQIKEIKNRININDENNNQLSQNENQ